MNVKDFLKSHPALSLFAAALLASLAWDPTVLYNVFEVNTSFPEAIRKYGDRWHLPSSGFYSAGFLSYLAAVCFGVSAFGASLLHAFWKEADASLGRRLAGSFWAGYLAASGIYRVFTLLLSPRVAVGWTWGVMVALTVGCLWKKVSLPDTRDKRSLGWLLGATAPGVAALFVLQVYQGDFCWVGHGSEQYLFLVAKILRVWSLPSIPVITQHCDEILFGIFTLAPLSFQFDPILPAALVLALNKISTATLVYSVFRLFGGGRLSSLAPSLFFSAGTFTLNPAKYLLYFDSSNPILFFVHSGRTVGVALWAYLLTSLLRLWAGKPPLWSATSLALLAFGINLTSISNFCFATVLILLAGLTPFLNPERTSAPRNLSLQGGLLLIFLGPLLAYFDAGKMFGPPGAPFFLTLVGALWIGAQVLRLRAAPSPSFREWKPALVWGAASAACLLFFANLFSSNELNLKLLEWLRAKTQIASIQLAQLPSFAKGRDLGGWLFVDAREAGTYIQYSIDSLHFWIQYGLFLVLGISALRLHQREHYADEERFRQGGVAAVVLLASFSILNLLFFYVDFVNDVSRSWIKTRFLEGPLFTFLLAFGVMTLLQKDAWPRRLVLSGAVAWSVIPFFATGRLSQWWANWEFLRSAF